VGQPQVIFKEDDNGKRLEPMELLVVDVPEETAGKVIELVSMRKGEMTIMEPKGDLQHLEFRIPSRGLIGLRNNVLTATGGEAIMNHRFIDFEEHKGQIPGRIAGSLISLETGPGTAYTIDKMQDRGSFFVDPGEEVYAGQVIGEHTRPNDLTINIQKGKKLTNMRASGSDENAKIVPKRQFSLEEAMEYIQKGKKLTNMRASGSDENAKIVPKRQFSLEEAMEYIQKDEYLEVTPKSVRMRKILLDENERLRYAKQAE
jgi:GTP-binding protein